MIKNGMRPIHPGEFLREEFLAPLADTTPDFWLHLQMTYDLKIAERAAGKAIEREVLPRAA